MATDIFYLDELETGLTIAGCVVRKAGLSRGSGVVTKSQDSAAAQPLPVTDTNGGDQLVFAIQVNAYSATTGNYNFNHWGHESNAMANFSACHRINAEVYDSGGTKRFDLWLGTTWSSSTEYGTSSAARTPTAARAGTARTINDGDFLVFRPGHGGIASPASGFTLNFAYNGTSAGANGDSFVTSPDTITAYTPPAVERHGGMVRPSVARQAVSRASSWCRRFDGLFVPDRRIWRGFSPSTGF